MILRLLRRPASDAAAEEDEESSQWETDVTSSVWEEESLPSDFDEDEETVMSTGRQVKVYNYGESEFETVGTEALLDTEFGEDVATQYRVVHAAQIRAGFEADSQRVGEATVGQVIDILEARLNAAGITRVRYRYGWLNTKASDGTVLLVPADDEATDSEWETETGTQYETVTETALTETQYETETGSQYETEAETELGTASQYYLVLAPARVRDQFEQDSSLMGVLEVGEIIETLEGRPNEAGIMRVRFSREKVPYGGWVSVLTPARCSMTICKLGKVSTTSANWGLSRASGVQGALTTRSSSVAVRHCASGSAVWARAVASRRMPTMP